MNEWFECRIDDLGEINRGKSKHRPRNDAVLFGGKYPFIQTADVKKAHLYITEYDTTYSDIGLAQSKLWKKGTLCITIAANIAESAILGIEACFPDSVVGFTPFKNKGDLKFVKYMLDEFKVYMQQISKGTTQDNLSLEKLRRVKFRAPSYDTQVRIAGILSTYDNLIENNNKRIKNLEQMAENLYKEWFVRFRFPGHETTPLENGIPRGWSEKRLSDLIDVDPLLPVKKGIQVKSIPMEALSTDSMIVDENCIQLVDNPSGSHSQNGDTLVARITPCLENGKTGFVQCLDDGETATGSTEFIVLRSKELSPYYVYCFARSEFFRQTAILSMNGADGRQRVNVPKIRSMKITKPSNDVIKQFNSIVKPIFEEIYLLTKQNKNNIKQRNLLLPRLMSGKLAV